MAFFCFGSQQSFVHSVRVKRTDAVAASLVQNCSSSMVQNPGFNKKWCSRQ